jgi:hypothetical protein
MTEGKKIIRAMKEHLEASAAIAVMKRTSSFHGTNDKLMKQFA